MTDVTHILAAVEAGNTQAVAELPPLVYEELRKVAAARWAAESRTPRRRRPATRELARTSRLPRVFVRWHGGHNGILE